MRRIKLDAIGSTNDFLKELSGSQTVENFTVVTAENQTKGKGQMGSVWNSEIGKNLIVSVLVRDFVFETPYIFHLNIAFSVAVLQALQSLEVPQMSIKWPNDILSGNKKIGGILIENSFKSDGTIISVAGLGLNVNQTHFENLPKASSLALVCNTIFDKEEILTAIIANFETNVKEWPEQIHLLWEIYQNSLFKKGNPMPFEHQNGQQFMGIIQGVSQQGKLQVLLENDSVEEFSVKEISMLY